MLTILLPETVHLQLWMYFLMLLLNSVSLYFLIGFFAFVPLREQALYTHIFAAQWTLLLLLRIRIVMHCAKIATCNDCLTLGWGPKNLHTLILSSVENHHREGGTDLISLLNAEQMGLFIVNKSKSIVPSFTVFCCSPDKRWQKLGLSLWIVIMLLVTGIWRKIPSDP